MEPVHPPTLRRDQELVCFGKDQEGVQPLYAAVTTDAKRTVSSFWQPTEEERSAIANGALVLLNVDTYGNPPAPVWIDATTVPEVPLPEVLPLNVIINGLRFSPVYFDGPVATYDQICRAALHNPEKEPTVVWRTANSAGTLLPGSKLELFGNPIVINVAETNKA